MNDEQLKLIQEKIKYGRLFMTSTEEADLIDFPDYLTDQQLKKPRPALFKEPTGGKIISLPTDFPSLNLKNDILEIFYKRKSSRVYTQETLSLLELSFLLWSTQGVKSIRGDNVSTARIVPCGGARYEFECYLAVLNVDELTPGYYHYMPDKHALELIHSLPSEQVQSEILTSLLGQKWASNANVIFYYSVIPYRAEWRYGIWTHRAALMDSGHITQNLYIACSSASLGTCAIAYLDTDSSNQMFALDGEEEFIFYAASVGKISDINNDIEDKYYFSIHEEV